ncbi:MAG: methyltransferase [Myxococcota bacterium]
MTYTSRLAWLPLLALPLVFAVGCASSETTPPTQAAESSGSEATDAANLTLDAIIASDYRSDKNKARDPYRHPVETLTFLGVEPDMRVVEIRPGTGWYTEILALYLKNEGQLTVGIPAEDGPRAKYRNRFLALKAERPDVLGQVNVVTFEPPAPIDLGEDESVDMVLTFRNTHNWITDGGEEEAYTAFFKVLRPGGTLGVVQHRASSTADPDKSAKNGYVPEPYVIKVAMDAGFEFVGGSDINSNPKDTRSHPAGVWTLPPVLRLGDEDRAKYEAIGESDRMTLKFRKPAK